MRWAVLGRQAPEFPACPGQPTSLPSELIRPRVKSTQLVQVDSHLDQLPTGGADLSDLAGPLEQDNADQHRAEV